MTATSTPPPALGSRLFRIRRTFALDDTTDRPTDRIVAIAAHALERRQLLALAISSSSSRDDPRAHFLIVRSVEEDKRVRHWRFPLAASHTKQQQQRVEPIAALAFSPEGDWLACLSTRKNRLHLVPVATLIATHRRTTLARTYQPPHNREWMSVAPSVMTTPMASYLRATNEAGGLNGARYHSRVAGDDTQMSTLEFATGMGAVTCCCWWRSMNGRDYCLVGGSDSIISIVNVQDNAEECRCELQQAGTIISIELFYESFRKEKRTSMLVTTRAEPVADGQGPMTKYYRVVLEKKTLKPPPRASSGTDATTTESTGATSPSTFQRFLPRPSMAETYVIKTFPEHFVEDMDFRPQRIKKNKPDVRLCAINGLLSSESGLAMYDATNHHVSVYSNFQWSLKGQYAVPQLKSSATDEDKDEKIVDVDIAYCSSDLLLLQGTKESTGTPIATWISLPSRQLGFDDGSRHTQDEAHVVHYLSLHGNERVENVLQTRSSIKTDVADGAPDGTGEVIYVIQTAHHVYECRPQWSRLALFRALRARTISLRDALSIGYALGTDMASLCEVVADTLCTQLKPQDPHDRRETNREELLVWIHDLYDVSRAPPSKSIEQLTRIGGETLAIAFAQRVLAERPAAPTETLHERQRVAILVAELIFQQQAQHSYNADPVHDQNTLRPRDATTQIQLEENEAWLQNMLITEEDSDYATDEMIELCLGHHKVQKAVTVAIVRDAVPFMLKRLIERGLSPALALPTGTTAVEALLEAGFAHELLAPAHRVVLRSLPMIAQLDVLLATKSVPTILSHRDWIVRYLPSFPTSTCVQLASMLDPSSTEEVDEPTASVAQRDAAQRDDADVTSSEYMVATAAERVELFLTLLLRINRVNSEGEDDLPDSSESESTQFSQHALETFLRKLATQYRPPIMIARCVDFENWNAAATLHEAHGELVDAVECRLHSHQRFIQKPGHHSRRQSSKDSKESMTEEDDNPDAEGDIVHEEETNESRDESDDLAPIRSELLGMVDALVLNTPTPAHGIPLKSSASITDTTRAAILARLMVKWFEYGLARADLEVYLIDPKVFTHVASPLSRIFFSEIIERVGSKGLHPSKSLALPKTGNGNEGFDERDKAWVRRCHALPFSGQFLFHVCMWLLDHQSHDSKTTAGPLPLVDVVKENIEKNDLTVRAVRIEPHSAQAIGKSDPLETHVKAFSCGHFFPKRIFDEDVLPEFEKRMTALPTPLFATKQLLLTEYKRSHVEAPCPVCAFNKISATVFEQRRQRQMPADEETTPAPRDHSSRYYFLHRTVGPPSTTTLPSPLGPSPTTPTITLMVQHDEWEWRGAATAS